jgi:hypothetical protein
VAVDKVIAAVVEADISVVVVVERFVVAEIDDSVVVNVEMDVSGV